MLGPWQSGDWQEASAPPLAVVHPGYAVALPRRPRRRPRRPEPAVARVPMAPRPGPYVLEARPDLVAGEPVKAAATREDEDEDEVVLLLALRLLDEEDR